MSRYVDLDGNTWDGTPISSKIHEMKTNFGYAQGYNSRLAMGDNVPHIDLEEHDKEVIQNYINNVVEELEKIKEEKRLACSEFDDEYDYQALATIIRAIEIVKGSCTDK